jgi:hypothetical protein
VTSIESTRNTDISRYNIARGNEDCNMDMLEMAENNVPKPPTDGMIITKLTPAAPPHFCGICQSGHLTSRAVWTHDLRLSLLVMVNRQWLRLGR